MRRRRGSERGGGACAVGRRARQHGRLDAAGRPRRQEAAAGISGDEGRLQALREAHEAHQVQDEAERAHVVARRTEGSPIGSPKRRPDKGERAPSLSYAISSLGSDSTDWPPLAKLGRPMGIWRTAQTAVVEG